MLVSNIEIPYEILDQWDKQLLPNFDIYFFAEAHEPLIKELGINTLVLPTDDFYYNNTLYTMDVINSYQMWQMKKDKLKYVCISHPSVITALDETTRTEIFKAQREVNNGLIFDWNNLKGLLDDSTLQALYPTLEPFIFKDDSSKWISIQQSLWGQLDQEVRIGFLVNFAKEFIDEVSIGDHTLQIYKERYPYLAPYFNSFSGKSGANCFAATLAAISGQDAETDWIISNWVLEDTLLITLESKQYKKIHFDENNLQAGDVLVWKNDKNTVYHACFHLGEGYFFNKHGQTFFNPWQVLTSEKLYDVWGKERIDLYRKNIRA